jgi:hypothetical protein
MIIRKQIKSKAVETYSFIDLSGIMFPLFFYFLHLTNVFFENKHILSLNPEPNGGIGMAEDKKPYEEQEHKHEPNIGNRPDDEETAAEIAPNPTFSRDREDRDDRRGTRTEDGGLGLGIAALVLSVLAFFFWPFVLSIAGIVVGAFAVRRKSSLGWWAIAVGIVALILAFVLFPIRLIF